MARSLPVENLQWEAHSRQPDWDARSISREKADQCWWDFMDPQGGAEWATGGSHQPKATEQCSQPYTQHSDSKRAWTLSPSSCQDSLDTWHHTCKQGAPQWDTWEGSRQLPASDTWLELPPGLEALSAAQPQPWGRQLHQYHQNWPSSTATEHSSMQIEGWGPNECEMINERASARTCGAHQPGSWDSLAQAYPECNQQSLQNTSTANSIAATAWGEDWVSSSACSKQTEDRGGQQNSRWQDARAAMESLPSLDSPFPKFQSFRKIGLGDDVPGAARQQTGRHSKKASGSGMYRGGSEIHALDNKQRRKLLPLLATEYGRPASRRTYDTRKPLSQVVAEMSWVRQKEEQPIPTEIIASPGWQATPSWGNEWVLEEREGRDHGGDREVNCFKQDYWTDTDLSPGSFCPMGRMLFLVQR